MNTFERREGAEGKAGALLLCVVAFVVVFALAFMTGCSCSSSADTDGQGAAQNAESAAAPEAASPDSSDSESPESSASKAATSSEASEPTEASEPQEASEPSEASEPGDGLVADAKSLYEKGKAAVAEFVEHREDAVPQHFAIGQMAAATKNVAVGVLSVEEGPYDFRDDTPTTKVTVAMANTSDHVVNVKASNWDADTTNGLRVDHKLAVYAKDGSKVAESFTFANVSPEGTYVAELYFDGALVDVLYEPHWLVSSENEYLYWDIG